MKTGLINIVFLLEVQGHVLSYIQQVGILILPIFLAANLSILLEHQSLNK